MPVTTSQLSQAYGVQEDILEGLDRFHSYVKSKGHQYLLDWVDTFTECIEAFLCRMEQAKEVVKTLI